MHADEVDVGGVRQGRREEADEEAGEVIPCLGDRGSRVEMIEEQPGQYVAHRAAPPVVDDGGDAVVVGRRRGAQCHVEGHGA